MRKDYISYSRKYKSFHYNELGDDALDNIHRVGYSMLIEIINLFNQHDIKYTIIGGTLLGAVTSKSFIPWDDDVDLCVFDYDYERMIDILMTYLPENMILQCKNSEPKYYHGWVKVRDINSIVYPSCCYEVNGVWVDIYKISLVPRKAVGFLKVKEHLDYLKRRYKVGDISLIDLWYRKISNSLYPKYLLEGIKYLLPCISDNVYLITSASKITINESSVLPLKKYMFEGLELNGINNADDYLTNHYGKDYHIYPDEDKRRVGINKVEIIGEYS